MRSTEELVRVVNDIISRPGNVIKPDYVDAMKEIVILLEDYDRLKEQMKLFSKLP